MMFYLVTCTVVAALLVTVTVEPARTVVVDVAITGATGYFVEQYD